MGCCLSSRRHNHEAEQRRSIDGEPPTSPPGILEVETVKEVLLETSVVPKSDDDKIKSMPPGNPECKPEVRPPGLINGKDYGEIVSEFSEISEVCSYSESLSTTTAQGKDGDVDDGVVDQRPPPRKRRAHGGGRGRGARRMATPSPEKRGQVAPLRPVRGRPMVAQQSNGAEENGSLKRKDVVEASGRRSRSPVRQEEVAPPRNESYQKAPAAAEHRNDVVSAEEAETLENPVVSLECFIFL